jgi:hypothetical protein
MCIYQYDFNVQKIYFIHHLFWCSGVLATDANTCLVLWYTITTVVHPVLYLGTSYNCRKNDLLVFSHLVQAFGTVIKSTFRLSCVVGSFSKAN